MKVTCRIYLVSLKPKNTPTPEAALLTLGHVPCTVQDAFAQGLAAGGGGGVEKKFLVPAYSFFFGGYPRRGRGVRKKIRAKIFSGPQNLKIP